jgi:large subunit ribosomal protein LP0
MVCGKNTVVKKAIDIRINELDEKDPDYDFRKPLYTEDLPIDKLKSYCKGKVGFIFSDCPVFELKPLIESNKIPAPAKVGTLAPIEVVIPPGPTGLDPSQISFFHTLNISTKIQKGQIEITKEFRVCEKGRKVGNSEAAILQKLNIKPFAFGMEILYVYEDGSILTPEVFNLDPNALLGKIRAAANVVTSISLAIGEPNALSIPHMIVNGFKIVAAIALETGIPLKELENLKAGGSGGAGGAGGAGGSAGIAAPVETEKKPVKVEEPEPKKDEDIGDIGDMFGGDDDY